MSNIIKKILLKISMSLLIIALSSCNNKNAVHALIYKQSKVVDEQNGLFFTTKYGGLNYYVENNDLFAIKDIDSIIFTFKKVQYMAKPLLSMSFSRERNTSSFSFYIYPETHKIITTKINNMNTILLIPENVKLKNLKAEGLIEYDSIQISNRD